MENNGRIFVSHALDDTARCTPLLTALDAWDIDYFFETQDMGAVQQLPERAQRELDSRDILLRVCTSATQRSSGMSLEVNTFRGLQANDHRHGQPDRRLLINLILDGDYTREPFDAATLFIDASSRPRQVWLGDLARAIGVVGHGGARRLSRRSLLRYGAATAVTVGSAAAAGALYADYHPVSAEAATTPHAPGSRIWQLSHASSKKDIPPDPTVAGTTLYVMSGLSLAAYDLSRASSAGPKLLWHESFSPQFIYNPVAAYGDTLYMALDNTLYSLHAANGAHRWSASLPASDAGSIMTTPLLAGNALYVLSEMGLLYAFSAKDGARLWRTSIEQPARLLRHASGPAVDDTKVYVGSIDHHIYALDVADGSIAWKTLTRGKVISSPTVLNGVVYVGSGDNYVYALHEHDGSVKWKYRTGSDVNSSPAVVDGVVYIASNDGYLYTFDADTGKPYWRAPIGDQSASGYISNGGPVICQPAVTGDAVAVIDTTFFTLRAYSRSNGAPRWKYTSADSLQNSEPVGAHGAIFFGSGDDTLYAFGA